MPQSAMASLVLSGSSVISRFLESVVDFQCPSASFSSLYHRRSLFSRKVSPAAQDSTVPCFPSAGLVSASVSLLVFASKTAPRGAAGLTSLLSSLEMLSPLTYFFFFLALSTIYDSQIDISHSDLFSKFQTPITNSDCISPLRCLMDIANATCPALNPNISPSHLVPALFFLLLN